MSLDDNNDDAKDAAAVMLDMPAENEMVSVTEICRLCANQSDRLVPIYADEGLSNDLGGKINSYLPVAVSEGDELPLQCCWGCASTLLAWHELVLASVEADRRLRSYQFVTASGCDPDDVGVDLADEANADSAGGGNSDDDKEHTVEVTSTLNVFCQTQAPGELEDDGDKIKKIHSPVYFTTTDASGVVDNFDNYINLQHPFIAEASMHDDQNIISFKDEDLTGIDTKQLESAEFQQHFNQSGDSSPKHDGEEYSYACHVCASTFVDKEDVVKHYDDVHPTDKIEETEVKFKEDSKKSKRRHTKIDQKMIKDARVSVDGRVYYNCKQCGKSLHSPYTYVWHVRIHTGERPYVCDLCGKQFRVSQGLIRHVRETHEGIKNFPCDICGRMFATKRNVEEHRRIHTNERPYICASCGKAFKQKASLFVHNRSHNDSFPFKCSYCNQGFRTKPPLLLHMTRHTGEKPYPCDVCGRRFRIKYELKRHRLIHSDEKPFSCSYCGLAFRQKRYLKNHLKLNHNDSLKSD